MRTFPLCVPNPQARGSMGLCEVGKHRMGNHQLHPRGAAGSGKFPLSITAGPRGPRCCPSSRAGWICSFPKGIQNAATAQFTGSPLGDGTGCQQLLPAQGSALHLCCSTCTCRLMQIHDPQCHSGLERRAERG